MVVDPYEQFLLAPCVSNAIQHHIRDALVRLSPVHVKDRAELARYTAAHAEALRRELREPATTLAARLTGSTADVRRAVLSANEAQVQETVDHARRLGQDAADLRRKAGEARRRLAGTQEELHRGVESRLRKLARSGRFEQGRRSSLWGRITGARVSATDPAEAARRRSQVLSSALSNSRTLLEREVFGAAFECIAREVLAEHLAENSTLLMNEVEQARGALDNLHEALRRLLAQATVEAPDRELLPGDVELDSAERAEGLVDDLQLLDLAAFLDRSYPDRSLARLAGTVEAASALLLEWVEEARDVLPPLDGPLAAWGALYGEAAAGDGLLDAVRRAAPTAPVEGEFVQQGSFSGAQRGDPLLYERSPGLRFGGYRVRAGDGALSGRVGPALGAADHQEVAAGAELSPRGSEALRILRARVYVPISAFTSVVAALVERRARFEERAGASGGSFDLAPEDSPDPLPPELPDWVWEQWYSAELRRGTGVADLCRRHDPRDLHGLRSRLSVWAERVATADETRPTAEEAEGPSNGAGAPVQPMG